MSWKRTIHLPDLIQEVDREKIRFPGGIICEVASYSVTETARRIEVVGEHKGILREICVGFASHPAILDVARRSSYVVEVRSMNWTKRHQAEEYKIDRLLLKRYSNDNQGIGSRLLTPTPWMKRMRLEPGDKIVISNPLIEFEVPSPQFGGQNTSHSNN